MEIFTAFLYVCNTVVVLLIPRLSRPAAQDFNDLEQVAVYQRG